MKLRDLALGLKNLGEDESIEEWPVKIYADSEMWTNFVGGEVIDVVGFDFDETNRCVVLKLDL